MLGHKTSPSGDDLYSYLKRTITSSAQPTEMSPFISPTASLQSKLSANATHMLGLKSISRFQTIKMVDDYLQLFH